MNLILLVDFGMVILIWMTQLIVYPGFSFYSEEELNGWHKRYTATISVIVIPLMTTQFLLHAYELWVDQSTLNSINAILIAILWIITFGKAVPLHNQIARKKEALPAAQKLVSINWYRTILWNTVFGLSLLEAIKS